MKIIPSLKTIFLTSIVAASGGVLHSCQEKIQHKPLYDVTLTENYNSSTNGKLSTPVKIEEGCSFETDTKIFVMSNGKLISIDKSNNHKEETDTIETSLHERRLFAYIASKNIEKFDEICLTANDIAIAKEELEQGHLTFADNTQHGNLHDGNNTVSLIMHSNKTDVVRCKFTYGDTTTNL